MLSDSSKKLRLKLAALFPLLNERQRRVVAASEAAAIGRGGVSIVAEITGMSRQTIYDGLRELDDHEQPARVRRSGGGRKKLRDIDPSIVKVLEEIVDPTTRGDPESPLRWTC